VDRRIADIIVAGVLTIGAILLYRKIDRLWWTYDDAYLLQIAVAHPATDHFGVMWQSMPNRLFTPLLTATYDAELSVFRLDAKSFYRVSLALLGLLSVVIFATARLWLQIAEAASAAVLLIAGAPMCALATQLMVVHYIESMIFGAASIALFVIALRRRSVALSSLSATFYMLAMLAKEIAVPLVAVLLLLPEATLRQRARFAAPHIMTLGFYFLWRRVALGEWIGGYGWTIRASDVPQLTVSFPIALLRHIGGTTAIGVALLVLIGFGILLRIRSTRDAFVVGTLLILSIAPILPMAKKLEARFVVVLWLCFVVIAVAGFATISNARIRNALLIAVPIIAIVVNRQTWAHEYSLSRRMSDEARAFFDLGAGDALRMPAVPPAAMSELKWLKETYLRKPGGAEWFYDDLFLCSVRTMPGRVFTWSERRREVVAMTGISSLRDRYCASIRSDAPLTASFHREGDALFWNFGPYEGGAYAVVIGDGVQAFEVPRADGFRLPGVTGLALRVRYRAPEGWVTYSPELQLDFSRRSDFAWHR
jgi:hypothetical protein